MLDAVVTPLAPAAPVTGILAAPEGHTMVAVLCAVAALAVVTLILSALGSRDLPRRAAIRVLERPRPPERDAA